MARTPFKLKSGNSPLYKNLGSSPVKEDKIKIKDPNVSVQDKTKTPKVKQLKGQLDRDEAIRNLILSTDHPIGRIIRKDPSLDSESLIEKQKLNIKQ